MEEKTMERNQRRYFTWTLLVIFALVFVYFTPLKAQLRTRTEINLPDILGFKILKCDFHIHTVFSDGRVWPPVRVEEAWLEGLDVIAITDHIEVQPFKEDIPTNYNRSYELAKPKADELGIILIKGIEITRSMPPGHFNAIFLKDADPLDTPNWRDAIRLANEQGAFVFWNHPGWKAQAPNGAVWYNEHTELYEKGWFQGIEIVNHYSYYPEVFQWALEKNLTILGNSDVHTPIQMSFDLPNGDHRPITLVFAEKKSKEAIKDALLKGRTAVYYRDKLFGAKKYLEPIFNQSVFIKNSEVKVKGKSKINLQIHNYSDVSFQLSANGDLAEISFPGKTTLYSGKTVLLQIQGKSETLSGTKRVKIPFIVNNLIIAPDQGLPVELEVEIQFEPDKK